MNMQAFISAILSCAFLDAFGQSTAVALLGKNESLALPSTQVPDAAPSNYRAVPWGPTTRRGYGFQGYYDPNGSLQPGSYVTCDLVWTIIPFLEEALEQAEPSGLRVVFYGNDFRIRLDFVMAGGSVANTECLKALSTLNLFLAGNEVLNTHPMQATISWAGSRKLSVAYELELGQQIHLDQHETMEFDGKYYSKRIIPIADVQNVINQAIAAVVIYAPAIFIVNWDYAARSRNARLHVELETRHPGRPRANITYGDLTQFLLTVKNFYSQHEGGFDLRGGVFASDSHVGFFNLELFTATHGNGMGNGTISKDNRVCAVTNGSIDQVGRFSTQQNALQGIDEVAATS